MAFVLCGTGTVTIKTVFLLWQGLTSALMIPFSISTNIVNKKVIIGITGQFSPNHNYQYSYCSQLLTSYNCMYFFGLYNG